MSNLKQRKITVTTGTRADYGILRPVLSEIQKNPSLKLFLIVTGMHLSEKHGKTINEIKDDGFIISNSFNMIPKKDSKFENVKQFGNSIISYSKIFHKIKPDINLVFGDRDEMLASTIAAYHLNIVNAHIHGGDRSQGGIDEYNRHAITKMSNIHFAASQKSKKRIIKMGENPKYVHFTGSPSIDELISKRITNKNELSKKYNFSCSRKNIILLQHPVTTQIEDSQQQIQITLRAIKKLKTNTIAIGPNSDPGSSSIFKELQKTSKSFDFINFYNNVPRNDFLGFLKYGDVLLGNSSSGMIEASHFGIPVVNIGIRQKGRERGNNVVDVEHSSDKIYQTTKPCLETSHNYRKSGKVFGNGTASQKIVKYLITTRLTNDILKKQIEY
ncbi:MAG: UDP-N-acetylglucosamine 2-epimerase (hydrolyzing) [Nitrosopumilus sp.]|nr:UDP-N-acetylglucosamine 2-epimerase (hydrolyzing) [Nitrosopumilus sp.]